MAIKFNADEVFQMAERIEINGEKFYRRGVSVIADPRVKELFEHLAGQEQIHRDVVVKLRESLPKGALKTSVFDPDGEAEAYLAAAADSHVFAIHDDPVTPLGDDPSPEEALNMALGFEKDTIVFFLGMREVTPDNLGGEEITKLIREEMKHVARINSMLAEVRK